MRSWSAPGCPAPSQPSTASTPSRSSSTCRIRGHKPASASQRFRSLQQYFKWLVLEHEIAASPMANMRPPHVPETPVPVLSDDDERRLFATWSGSDEEARRDAAMLRVFLERAWSRWSSAGGGRQGSSFTRTCSAIPAPTGC
jgi:site-specific recombinase XerC